MNQGIKRREFLQIAATGTALGVGASRMMALGADPAASRLISPGCRGTKVKVARLYMGTAHGLWPKPKLDLDKEIRRYQAEFEKLGDDLRGVEFFVDQLVTSPKQVEAIKDKLKAADGILVIHLNIGIWPILQEICRVGRPTVVFAVPYSGHEWVHFGELREEELGAKLDCMLTTDYRRLADAIRPFRAMHHLREAKILNLSTRAPGQYPAQVNEKFGTEIKQIALRQVLDAYQKVDDGDAKTEADRWMQGAVKVVEPSAEEVYRSCKLALAFEKLLDQEDATVMTVDCYGTMWDRTIKLPAYPCIGFARLNNMGLGGICESDLQCAMTHILMQGLVGKPGFISDPTMDESTNSIILAHCLGTPKMDGPDRPAAPYKLRTIMERQEGAVTQVKMRLGQKVTQAKLVGTDAMVYFTGEITDAPDVDRGCRTKITVKLDGDAETLWKNWSYGLHRVTCYGDVSKELERFCRYKQIQLVNEAV